MSAAELKAIPADLATRQVEEHARTEAALQRLSEEHTMTEAEFTPALDPPPPKCNWHGRSFLLAL